ncbi:hypothetical protein WJX77_000951 [Trebouxia sp. C0004]
MEQEGRMAAIPAGWLTVPPVVLKDPREPTPPISTDSQASTQGDSAASDPAEVQRAAAFMAGYKSYRDLQEPGQYALYKNAVQEQITGGSTICTCEDPLAKLAYIKANLRSVSFEERNMTVLLRKPCLDISMWAGYDPNDGQKNLNYYKTWQERFVVTPNNGNATMNDTYNKYQEWSRSARNGFVGPITCIQDLLDFYSWKYLEDSEMAAISTFLWESKSADDCILYNCFSSTGSQTLIRDTELLQLQRMRSSLSKSSQYQTSFGPLKLLEVVSKGVQKTNKTSYLYSWMIRRRQIDHLCPFFWTAARLFHDYQRMQPGQPGNQHGSLVEVIRDGPSVTIDRASRSNPLTEVKRTQRSVANMMPLMSGRAYMRVGNGPMDSCFHHATARNFSKQILQSVLGSKLLGIKERVKGASLRLLRQSAMRRMLFFGARILSMARFASEAELETFLGKLDQDYGQYASAVWQNGVRTAQQLANADKEDLVAAGVTSAIHAKDIKARAGPQVSQEQAHSSAWQQQAAATDQTGQYVRQLLEPALTTVPLAADVPSLFQSALYCSGTLPFPVPDVFYESQKRQDDDMKYYLAPVSRSGAVAFSSTIHAVLLKNFPAGSEMVQAGQFDQLVCDIMELLDQYARQLNLKRKRNEGEVSLTLNAKRPDLCVLVRSALLFKGEDKTEEGQLDQAVAELKQKMRRWSQSYHGQVEFLLCYAMAGGRVRICMLRRDDPDSCHVAQKSLYTAGSDLALVGQLLTEPGLPPLGESGSHFAEELMAKSLSLEQALHHVWLHP